MTTYSGGCQCGAVRFHATALRDNSHVCHCRMCQKAVGNFFAALVGVTDTDLTWTRGTPAIFNSSQKVERGFCRDCGTPLFFHWTDGSHHSLCIGAFDSPAEIPLAYEYGAEGKLPQVAQLAAMTTSYVSEVDGPDEAMLALRTNRQHPDHDTAMWPAWG